MDKHSFEFHHKGVRHEVDGDLASCQALADLLRGQLQVRAAKSIRSDLPGKLRALADRLNGGNLRKHPNEDEVRAAASLIERFETLIDLV